MNATRIALGVTYDDLVRAINDHAKRIDDHEGEIAEHSKMLFDLTTLSQRVGALERVVPLQPPDATLTNLAKATAHLSWGDHMREEIRKEREQAFRAGERGEVCSFAPSHEIRELINQAEAGMRTEWRPMATAPRDGRWVLLRKVFGTTNPVTYLVGSWDPLRDMWKRDEYSGQCEPFLTGWLPIPGEVAP